MKNSLKTLFIRIDGYGFFNLVFGTVRWFVVLLMRRIYSEKKLKRRIYDFEMYLDIFDDGLSKQLIKYKKRELDHKYMVLAGSFTTSIKPSLKPKQLTLFEFIVGENGGGLTKV